VAEIFADNYFKVKYFDETNEENSDSVFISMQLWKENNEIKDANSIAGWQPYVDSEPVQEAQWSDIVQTHVQAYLSQEWHKCLTHNLKPGKECVNEKLSACFLHLFKYMNDTTIYLNKVKQVLWFKYSFEALSTQEMKYVLLQGRNFLLLLHILWRGSCTFPVAAIQNMCNASNVVRGAVATMLPKAALLCTHTLRQQTFQLSSWYHCFVFSMSWFQILAQQLPILTWGFLWFLSAPPGKCWCRTLNYIWLLPSKSFPIHYSIIILSHSIIQSEL
jgi:hypothetical protein